jgi:hypothetical protein
MSEQPERKTEAIRLREMRRIVPLLVLYLVGATTIATNSGAADCGYQPVSVPIRPIGPDSTWVNSADTYRTMATTTWKGQVKFVFNWGKGNSPETTDLFGSGETASVAKTWTSAGVFSVSALAISSKEQLSRQWSETLHVRVYPGTDR